jgi:hypothetical protein
MTHDEAKKTMCPLSVEDDNCVADKCNWWLEDGPAFGECAIRRVARMLSTPMIFHAPTNPAIPEGPGLVGPNDIVSPNND